jgi:hypothetical protein
LTKLDLLFDDMSLDSELFGKELPSHYLLMSFVGGFMAVPLYLLMNFMSISQDTMLNSISRPPLSFMGLVESTRYPSSFNFYASMFDSRWENILLMLTIALLYLLKPLTTTRFLLSLQPNVRSLTYYATELFSKALFVVISIVAIEKHTKVERLVAFGFVMAMMSQLWYYWASQEGGRKDRVEIRSAVQAVREMDKFENVEEVKEVEQILQRLDTVIGPLDIEDAYKLLLDVALSDDRKS